LKPSEFRVSAVVRLAAEGQLAFYHSMMAAKNANLEPAKMTSTMPATPTGADAYKLKILAALAGPGGFMTGQVAERVTPMFGSNKRQHTGAIRSWLLELKAAGLVREMDDQKPVVWCAVTAPVHSTNES
jgi:hypothetical protein